MRIVTMPLVLIVAFSAALSAPKNTGDVLDLSLLVAVDLPSSWPGNQWPLFQLNPYVRIGQTSAYNSEIFTIDGNTATQLDTPPHSVPAPSTRLPNAYPAGEMFIEKVPAWQFAGEACVIDVRNLRDGKQNGHSPLITPADLEKWEKKYRPLRFGDVALFTSGYSDAYYRVLPDGRRFAADPVEGKAPAWPDPDPAAMEYVAKRGVLSAGTDSASMGPLPDLGEPTHFAGLKHGMIWTEGGTNYTKLPPTGAFYCLLAPKYVGSFASEARALAIIGGPAQQLIESARNKRVVDLSMPMSPDLPLSWPGAGVGNHRQPLLTLKFGYSPATGAYQTIHIMDAHTGTHLVPPAYALPLPAFSNNSYSPEVSKSLSEYEKRYGRRGTSDMTVDKVPVSQTVGRLRVVDVRSLAGSTQPKEGPTSPEIKSQDLDKFESANGKLEPGDIVVFRTGQSDRCMEAKGDRAATCMSDAINGKSEGWPSPGPAIIKYLARKGVRAVGIDAPTLGGVEPRRALMTYWALGSEGMVGIEYLANLAQAPQKAYLIFASIKIRDAHGAPGRALAFY